MYTNTPIYSGGESIQLITKVKIARLQYKNTSLQLKVLHWKGHLSKHSSLISKIYLKY